MNKGIVSTAIVLGTLGLSACGSSTPAKSVKITKGASGTSINHDMATLSGTAKGYKYVAFASDGSIGDVAKVKNGKWSVDADSAGKSTGYLVASNKKIKEYADFAKGDYPKVIKMSFTASALSEASAFSSSADKAEAADKAASSSKKAAQASSARKSQAHKYDAQYSYNQLARTPDKYKDKSFHFAGTVVQVVERTNFTDLLVAMNDNPDTVILVEYDPAITHGTRVLENDTVVVYGTSEGTTTYQSADNTDITRPGVTADKISIAN